MKKIEVLLSSYNGENYIEQQILTILNQEGVDVHLTIRDDGSKDDTVAVVKKLMINNPSKIALFECENCGYKKSFLNLLSLSQDADYYAFADQDDIWLPQKLLVAVTMLENNPKKVKLYSSNLTLVNDKHLTIGETQFKKKYSSLKSDFARHRLAGCTYVFSKELKRLAERINCMNIPESAYPSHDFFLSACAYACGTVILDEMSYIKHVRRLTSVTSGGNGIIKRIKIECKSLFFTNGIRENLARLLIETYRNELTQDALDFLTLVANYKRSLKHKMKLLFTKEFSTGIWICDLEKNLSILLSTY